MDINYGGFVPLSTVDWFGNSVAVVFFRGCSLGCKDCLNKTIIDGENLVDIETLKQKILGSKIAISGVVFTGGEPCEQIGVLTHLIYWCKSKELKVFLHTSGNKPKELGVVVRLLDGIRLDYKPKEQFGEGVSEKRDTYLANYIWSKFIILSADIPYWFSSVALRNSNQSLKDEYEGITSKKEQLIIMQGNEENPFTPEELQEKYKNCYIYTKENGLQWSS